MRCLALAQAWQDAGGCAVFAMAQTTAAIQARLAAESCELRLVSCATGTDDDSRQTIALAREQAAEWIVVDGYQFTAEYQHALKAAGFKVLFLDDYGHAGHYFADLVLNQNAHANDGVYAARESYTRLLLGTRYCLLRREFAAWRDWKREIAAAGNKVLVTMGGSDPKNLTARAMEALALVRVKSLEAVVVVGGGTSHSELIESSSASAVAGKESGKKVSVRRDVANMAELMAWADVAVSSAGSTCWELCLLGLPSLLVDVADNQTEVAKDLDRRGCAIHLGSAGDFSAERVAEHLDRLLKSGETRHSMSIRGRELVDGRGAVRVASAVRGGLRMRRAQDSDCRLFWEWANDAEVRGAAFSTSPIPWEQHESWFASKMKDPNCRILVGENDEGRPVGQFRVDWRSDGDGEIDVSVAKDCRGAGYGRALIESGVSSVFAERGERLHAFVKTDNHASRSAFELAGFTSLGEEEVQQQRAIHYVRSTNQRAGVRSE
jgi:UDP-2,4-diacetamido-2,4,6-trideoxy-beta-L-altropyranose hydrolase